MHQNISQKNWGSAFIVTTSLTKAGNIKKWRVTWEFALTSAGKHTGTQNKQCSKTGRMPSLQSCSMFRHTELQTRTQQTSCSKSWWRHSCNGKNMSLWLGQNLNFDTFPCSDIDRAGLLWTNPEFLDIILDWKLCVSELLRNASIIKIWCHFLDQNNFWFKERSKMFQNWNNTAITGTKTSHLLVRHTYICNCNTAVCITQDKNQ
jgi:hypothetical protein